MARSYKKTPIFGITKAQSEKYDKRLANRRLRSKARQMLYDARDYDAINHPLMREVADVWDMVKDGKRYRPRWYSEDFTRKAMRK